LSCHPACAERQSNKAHLEKSQTFVLHRQGGHSGSFESLEISLCNGLRLGGAIVAEFVEEVMWLG
jgi:hypothetical protein